MNIKKSHLVLFASSIILIIIAYAFQAKLAHFKAFGLLGLFLINLIGSATLFLPAPALASVVAGGVVYPIVLVALVSAFGASIGDMLGYVLGREGKYVFLDDNKHPWYKKIKYFFTRFGGWFIFIAAFIPNPLFDAVGILAGVSNYSPYRFFVFMFVGRFLRDILLAGLGHMMSGL